MVSSEISRQAVRLKFKIRSKQYIGVYIGVYQSTERFDVFVSISNFKLLLHHSVSSPLGKKLFSFIASHLKH